MKVQLLLSKSAQTWKNWIYIRLVKTLVIFVSNWFLFSLSHRLLLHLCGLCHWPPLFLTMSRISNTAALSPFLLTLTLMWISQVLEKCIQNTRARWLDRYWYVCYQIYWIGTWQCHAIHASTDFHQYASGSFQIAFSFWNVHRLE